MMELVMGRLKLSWLYFRNAFRRYLGWVLVGVGIIALLPYDLWQSQGILAWSRTVVFISFCAATTETLFIALINEDPVTTIKEAAREAFRHLNLPQTGKNPNNPR